MPLTSKQMLSIIRNGLARTPHPKKIIVVGAGMAGLVTASLLKEAGHEVVILEATQRVGGRIYTLREPFVDDLYLDVGAMRIPSHHELVIEYIKKFGLEINAFVNTTPNDIIFANGVKTTRKNYQQHPDILRYPVAPHEKGKTAGQLLLAAIQPVIDYIQQDPLKHWQQVIRQFDRYSMETFLRYNPVGASLSSGAVELCKVLLGLEGFPNLSFPAILRELLPLLTPNMLFYEIKGGNDHLPQAFMSQLKDNIFLNQQMIKISQEPHQVTIHSIHTQSQRPLQTTGDLVILTIPFTMLKFVEIEPRHSFSHNKRKAIRELHYVPSTKIGLQFRHRFWEGEGLKGGSLATDLPIRFAYYPSHLIGSTGSGIVLASYTWEDDTLSWDNIPEPDRIRNALDNLATVHGEQIYDDFLVGASHSWSQYRYTGGAAFSMFKPNQETDLYPSIYTPEGRVYFAGEHTSTHPAWIEGAVQSGIRVANDVNYLL
ncbi:putative L-amino-acid oxidase YobN [Pullulanibacillus camelliae]|uniref:Putative L-amino-acid oxidase YobN n=1 Tax=Pullulanibacillus camelliae TaxID=1707096 RepID=A0A8J2VJ44_9BACL|nr:flavin monoamine oxidase family protein [Pullulanibacillus camelliae]GGE31518.1 putative L-amino-acid oxidase YobN [Pullulanibacillus camelliae]